MPRRFASIEEQRAYWRAKSKRQYQRRLEADPGVLRAEQREKGRRYREKHPPVRKTSRRLLVPKSCIGCGVEFQPKASDQRYHDHACYCASRQSCQIRIQECEDCGSLFTAHGKRLRKWCSQRCGARRWQREYQRRTKYTATRYWQVDATPEAQEVARLYYQLRQHLRGVRHGNRQGGPDPSRGGTRNDVLAR